jgi:ribosomal protein L29
MTAEEREERLEELKAQLLALETEEEAAIRGMEQRGEQAPWRRADVVNLDILLGD